MKTIFTPRFVCKAQLFQPNLLVRAIDFIADNEAELYSYRELGKMMIWSRGER
jgi:hypothetical protein